MSDDAVATDAVATDAVPPSPKPRGKRGRRRGATKNSAKRFKFARLYFRFGDVQLAYLKAGYKGSGSSLAANSSKLLNTHLVQVALKDLQRRYDARLFRDMSQEWQKTREVRRDIAYSDISDLFVIGDDGFPVPKPGDEVPQRALRSIRSVEVVMDEDGKPKRFKYQFAPKEPHLEALEEKFSLLPDTRKAPTRVDITSGGQPLPDTVDGRRDAVMTLLTAWRERSLGVSVTDESHQLEGGVEDEDEEESDD